MSTRLVLLLGGSTLDRGYRPASGHTGRARRAWNAPARLDYLTTEG